MDQVLVDIGSHSVKLYEGRPLRHVKTVSWELLERGATEHELAETLSSIVSPYRGRGMVRAVGTEAMRRNPAFARSVQEACGRMGVEYQTISQVREAELIRVAAAQAEIPASLDIVNVGGGSVQIAPAAGGACVLLDFGISDLNRRFGLNSEPAERRVAECIDWLVERLPTGLGRFTYTGGEWTYLRHFGVPLHGGWCQARDFRALAAWMDGSPMEELQRRSPFDGAWMRGAIASNCVVLASVQRSRSDEFLPTDFNIAHGLAAAAWDLWSQSCPA